MQRTVSINKANVMFEVSASAMANSVPLKEDRTFGIKLEVNYKGGGTEEHYQAFNACAAGQQAVSMQVNSERAGDVISSIKILFIYDYNVGMMTACNTMVNVGDLPELAEENTNTAYIDNPPDQYKGILFEEDTHGNVLSTKKEL